MSRKQRSPVTSSASTPLALLNEMLWLARMLPARLGKAGFAGAALIAGAIGIWANFVLPATRAQEELRMVLEARRAAMRVVAHRVPPSQPVAKDPLADLASEREFHAIVERVIALGEKYGVLVSQGAYRIDNDPQSAQLRLSVLELPARGSYVGVRQFLAALADVRGLSVESMQIARAGGGETELNLNLKLAVLVRSGR